VERLDFGLKSIVYRFWMYFYYWIRQVEFKNFTRTSYSQNQEDELLTQFLPEKFGNYLDIGAGHPIRGSNTFLLYKRGWTGTTVDPILGMHLLHRIYRRRDRKLLAIVGKSAGEELLYEYSPTEYSTVSEARNRELIESGAMYFRKYKVQSLITSDLGCEVDPCKPFLLSIDTEGMDLPILRALLEIGASPRVICVEGSNFEEEIVDFLLRADYKLMYSTGLNLIFVHRLYLEMK
jgi:hypothetical protein